MPAQPAVPAYAYPGAPPAPAQGGRTWPGILIGCGVAAAIAIVLLIIGGALLVSSPDFQRGFCNGFTSSNPNAACPFNPPATPSQ